MSAPSKVTAPCHTVSPKRTVTFLVGTGQSPANETELSYKEKKTLTTTAADSCFLHHDKGDLNHDRGDLNHDDQTATKTLLHLQPVSGQINA